MSPTIHRDTLIAGYAALAVVIHVLEAALPSPVPGIKPGLANVVTLVVLLRFGFATACWVALLRVLVASLLLGSFLTPTFLLSLSGALASLLALGLGSLWNAQFSGWRLSALGLGTLAAWAHMSAQFAVAYALFVRHSGLLVLLPVLLTAATGFGLLTGWLAQASQRHMAAPLAPDPDETGY